MGMDRQYKAIRAAAPGTDYGEDALGLLEPLESKKRRVGVSIACNACRRKKIRCDGQRPTCTNCWGLTATCVYRDNGDLSTESKKLVVEVVTLLNGFAAADTLRVLRTLKSENNASAILSFLRNESRQDDETEATTMADGAGRAHGQFEFEMRNAAAYPVPSTRATSRAPTQSDPDLITASRRNSVEQSEQPEPTRGHSSAPAAHGETESAADSDVDIATSELCDARLDELDIKRWTPVQISNLTAARCISLYLETDHPLLGHFDPELFVSHLVSGSSEYCSPLLVNSLLYWASQMYGHVEPGMETLALEFCAEAERLWAAERSAKRDSITTIAAAEFMCLGHLAQGKGHTVLMYIAEASEMGTRMGLFGPDDENDDDDSDESDESDDDDVATKQKAAEFTAIDDPRRAKMFAAWGAFNWITLMSLFYRQPGLICSKSPPSMPIPDYGSLFTAAADVPQPRSPPFMGVTFPHVCQFWRIVHEVSVVYQGDGIHSWGSEGSLFFAEFKFRELLAWSNNLPSRLKQGGDHPHHVLILHLWLHAIILGIFRPFTQTPAQNSKHLRTFSGKPTTVNDVCAASVAQLERLIAEYRVRYKWSKYTFLWQTALIYVVNAILNDKRDVNWYTGLLLCIYAYQSLGRASRVSATISKSLLSLALRKSEMSPVTAKRILHELERGGMNEIRGEVRATFIADLNLALADYKTAATEQLALEFEGNVWMRDYTTIFDDDDGVN